MPFEWQECYFITVPRLLTLLIMFAFMFTNAPALATAMCQHADARAHAAALQSADAGVSLEAQDEESAARTSSQAALGDAAMTLLGGFILPLDTSPLPLRFGEAADPQPHNGSELGSRSVPPLLEPPLA